MTEDLANSLPILAERIRKAYALTERARQEWIEGTLELAAALAEARKQFTADQQFSIWLAQNDLDGLRKNDRAALINMAADLHLARIVLEETGRHSWRLIWDEEMTPRFPSAGKPTEQATTTETPPETPENAAIEPGSHALSQRCWGRPPTPTPAPPSKPDYLTISQDERAQAQADAERRQQQVAAAFEADQAARHAQEEAEMAAAEAASACRYDALVAAWEAAAPEEQQRFRDFIEQ